MTRPRTRRLLGVLAVAALALAGCGDSEQDTTDTDDPGSTGNAAATTTGGGGAPDTGGGSSRGCPAEVFAGTITRQADDFAEQPAGTMAEAVDAVAFGMAGNWTIYVADHPIDRGPFEAYASGEFSTDNAVVAEPGGVLATIFLLAGTEDLTAGSTAAFTADGMGGTVIVDTGGGAQANNSGAAGTATIIDVTDEQICVEVDYADGLQTVEGTVSAEIYPS